MRCVRCNRKLTNKDSITRKYGYTCYIKTFGKPERKKKLKVDKWQKKIIFKEEYWTCKFCGCHNKHNWCDNCKKNKNEDVARVKGMAMGMR